VHACAKHAKLARVSMHGTEKWKVLTGAFRSGQMMIRWRGRNADPVRVGRDAHMRLHEGQDAVVADRAGVLAVPGQHGLKELPRVLLRAHSSLAPQHRAPFSLV
jgi:hypothetical protein